MSVLTVLVIGLTAFALVAGNRSSDDDLPPPAPADTPEPTTTFRDAETGSTLEYPRAWRRVRVPDATYRLVLDGGNNVAMTFRVFTTEVATTPANLENIKAVTDGIVASNPTVKVVNQRAIQLNGMIGYYYLYTFIDDAGLQAAHSHYFLFQGRKMNMIVFQAPPDDFDSLGDTFDRIINSFRSDPNVVSAAPAPTSTTATTAAR